MFDHNLMKRKIQAEVKSEHNPDEPGDVISELYRVKKEAEHNKLLKYLPSHLGATKTLASRVSSILSEMWWGSLPKTPISSGSSVGSPAFGM